MIIIVASVFQFGHCIRKCKSVIWPHQAHHLAHQLHQTRWNNCQVKLHQFISSMDQLRVAELKSYIKSCMRYFVKFHLLTRIIYFLNRACCYYSISPRRMTRTHQGWTIEKNHVESVRPRSVRPRRTITKNHSYFLIPRSFGGPWVHVGKILKSTL
jgi:hypothetical protein